MLLVFDSDAPGFTIPGFRSFRGPKSHSWEKPFHFRILKYHKYPETLCLFDIDMKMPHVWRIKMIIYLLKMVMFQFANR